MRRSERQKSIIQEVDSGFRSVADLIRLTGCSAVTIRRDLAELDAQGALIRTMGGAAPAIKGEQYPFPLRADSSALEKQRLARAVAEIITPGMSVFIDHGTTASAIARELAGIGITALAMSLHGAAALASRSGNQVIVPGGTVNPVDLSFSSVSAEAATLEMHFDWAIISSCAADPGTGLTAATLDDARIKRAAILASQRTMLVSTPEKFGRSEAHRIGDFSILDLILTMSPAPVGTLKAALRSDAELSVLQTES